MRGSDCQVDISESDTVIKVIVHGTMHLHLGHLELNMVLVLQQVSENNLLRGFILDLNLFLDSLDLRFGLL